MEFTIHYSKPDGTYQMLYEAMRTEAHTLIAGSTGCGKSVLLNNFIDRLLLFSPNSIGLMLIDPKRIELVEYANLPHTLGYAQDEDEAIDLLKNAINIMEDRYCTMQTKRIKKWDASHVYIIIDELADLMVSTRAKETKLAIQKIAQLGRAAGIHLVACTQSPSRLTIPAAMTLNFTCRIGMKCESRIESNQIIKMNGCEELPRHGKVIVLTADGYQTASVSMADKEVHEYRMAFWNGVKSRKEIMDEVASSPKYFLQNGFTYYAN